MVYVPQNKNCCNKGPCYNNLIRRHDFSASNKALKNLWNLPTGTDSSWQPPFDPNSIFNSQPLSYDSSCGNNKTGIFEIIAGLALLAPLFMGLFGKKENKEENKVDDSKKESAAQASTKEADDPATDLKKAVSDCEKNGETKKLEEQIKTDSAAQEAKAAEIERNISEKQTALNNAEMDLEIATNVYHKTKDELISAEKAEETAVDDLNQANDAYDEACKSETRAQNSVNSAESELSSAKSAAASADPANKAAAETRVRQAESKLKAAKSELEEAKETKSKAEKNKKEKEEALEKAKEKCSGLRDKIKELEKDIEEKEAAVKKAEKELDTAKNEKVTNENWKKEIDDAKKVLDKHKNDKKDEDKDDKRYMA